MKEIIRQAVETNASDVKSVCSGIYAHPETANHEVEACKALVKLLKEKGFAVEENYTGQPTAFRATKKNGQGPRIAIPVEYDALPGIGHACGHHLIAAMSVLTGISLAEALGKYCGEVTLFGTPAEETGEGKPPMVEQGAFDDYDAAMMLHPASFTCVEPKITSIGVYDITFYGKTAHCGAAPHDGINALDAVVSLYNSVSMMRQQMKDGTRIAAIVIEGGAMTNSVPDKCVIRYEIRTLDMDYYEHVRSRLEKCAQAAAIATGCTVDFRLSMPVCASMTASKSLAEAYQKILDETGKTDVRRESDPFATDMGEISLVVPSLHPLVKVSQVEEKLHTEEFLKATNLPYAWEQAKEYAYTMARLGLQIFEDEQLLAALRSEREILIKKRRPIG